MSDDMIVVGRYTGMASSNELAPAQPATKLTVDELVPEVVLNENGPEELQQGENEETEEGRESDGSGEEDGIAPTDEQDQETQSTDELEPSKATQKYGY